MDSGAQAATRVLQGVTGMLVDRRCPRRMRLDWQYQRLISRMLGARGTCRQWFAALGRWIRLE